MQIRMLALEPDRFGDYGQAYFRIPSLHKKPPYSGVEAFKMFRQFGNLRSMCSPKCSIYRNYKVSTDVVDKWVLSVYRRKANVVILPDVLPSSEWTELFAEFSDRLHATSKFLDQGDLHNFNSVIVRCAAAEVGVPEIKGLGLAEVAYKRMITFMDTTIFGRAKRGERDLPPLEVWRLSSVGRKYSQLRGEGRAAAMGRELRGLTSQEKVDILSDREFKKLGMEVPTHRPLDEAATHVQIWEKEGYTDSDYYSDNPLRSE